MAHLIFQRKWKKRRFFIFLKRRFDYQLKFFTQNKLIYWPIYREINLPFSTTINYNAYQNQFKWAKNKIRNFRYHAYVNYLKRINFLTGKWHTSFFNFFKNLRHLTIFNFLYLYINFFLNSTLDFFYFLKKYKKKKRKALFFLIFSFKLRKIFLSLQDRKHRNYLFLSTGLFIKFFEKKKSIKKNKTIKLLMARFLRKIFLLTNVKRSVFIIKKTPVYLLEMLNFLNSPIAHKFSDPVTEKVIDDESSTKPAVKALYFIFKKNQDFSTNKIKKKGRVKRKVLRKLILENRLTD